MSNNSSVVTYEVQVYTYDHDLSFDHEGNALGEWKAVGSFTEGTFYYVTLDALAAAKYVAEAAKTIHKRVRVYRYERIRTYMKEEIDLDA